MKYLAVLIGIATLMFAHVCADKSKSEPLQACELANSCSSGISYCPDSGTMDMYTNWYPTPSNPSKCVTERNQLSFDIVVSNGYDYVNVTQAGTQSGERTIAIRCNTGMAYYQYLRNQQNTDWDCQVTFAW